MASRKKALALVALAAALGSRWGRAQGAAVLGRTRAISRRRRQGLPKGVQEFPPVLVDRRHVEDGPVATRPVHGETAAEITTEFYEDRPPT